MNGSKEMFLNLCLLLVFLGRISCYENGHIFGVIQRQGEDIEEELFRKVLQKELQSDRVFINFQTITEVVPQEDAWYYHRAICRLLEKGVQVIVSPTSFSTFPILASYSNEFKFPFISPELPEAPDDAPDLIAKYGFGIRPSTTRASLDLIRYFGWQNMIYIYDDDFGPEKLQIMFRVAYSVLNLHLVGFLKTTSAEDTLKYLQKLDHSSTHKVIPVLLDVNPSLAKEILLRFVHDVGVRKEKYSFLLIQPTLEDFWTENEAEFRILNITGFLTVKPDFTRFNSVEEAWRKLYYYKGPFPNSNMKLSYYYYHDAALVLAKAVQSLPVPRTAYPSYKIMPKKFPGCFHEPHTDLNFGYPNHIRVLKNVRVPNGLTGRIEFEKWNETQSKRINFNLTIVQSTSTGYQELGIWSNEHHGLHLNQKPLSDQPGALPQVDNKLRVTAKLEEPYLMLKTGDNVTHLQGNDRFEGYCKDIMDSICEYIQVECELKLVEDGQYGRYDPKKGRWTGMVGELIQGKADIAIADLSITGERQRVVDFTDAYELVSLSLLMKNPNSIGTSSSVFFIFNAFSVDVWICSLVAFIFFCAFFHVTTKFTGAPDSIESASGIWGRKNRIVVNVWFSVGSTLMQGTGVYPRSISSRILSGGWWFFTSVMTCMFIASLVFQLQVQNTPNENSLSLMQLKSLSVESIIHEAVENGWPKVGLIYQRSASRFIKASTLPLYKKYEAYMENNPSVFVSNTEEGIERVRKSSGGYILLTASAKSDYETRRSPCDLVATQDPYIYGGYGIATPLKSPLRYKVNEALSAITGRGLLGHLHRKWWIDSSQCKNGFIETSPHGDLHSFSGLFYILLIGCAILITIFVIQYFRKIQHKEDRLQQLTFDDRTLEHHLPDPPPELLENPPPVLNLPEIEKRDFCDAENFNEFFERMKTGR